MGEVYIGIAGIVAVLIAIVIYVISQYLRLRRPSRRELVNQVSEEKSRRRSFAYQLEETRLSLVDTLDRLAVSQREAGTAGNRLGLVRKKLAASKKETADWQSAHSYVMEREEASKQANGALYRAQQQKLDELGQALADERELVEAGERSFGQLAAAADSGLDKLTAERDEARDQRDILKNRLADARKQLATARELADRWEKKALAIAGEASELNDALAESQRQTAGCRQDVLDERVNSERLRTRNAELRKQLEESDQEPDLARAARQAIEKVFPSRQDKPAKSPLKGCACWPACRTTPDGELAEDYADATAEPCGCVTAAGVRDASRCRQCHAGIWPAGKGWSVRASEALREAAKKASSYLEDGKF